MPCRIGADSNKSVERVIAAQAFLALPVIVLGEYRYRLCRSNFKTIPEVRRAVLCPYGPLLDVTQTTAQAYAEIRAELKNAGMPIPSNDVWIAALAREHNLPILSRDAHFEAVKGVIRVGW